MSVLHRVVAVDREQGIFRTKGDANESVDPGPVEYSRYEGKAVFSIPYLGFVVHFLQSGVNRIWIAAGIGLLTAVDWHRRRAGRRRAV